jgi:hypothetical protein
VATLYESEAAKPRQAMPACCLGSLHSVLEEEGHTYVDPDTSKSYHVRILRICVSHTAGCRVPDTTPAPENTV